MPPDLTSTAQPVRVPFWLQFAAWLSGVLACLAGMMNLIAGWNVEVATVQFLLLLVAPPLWMIQQPASKYPTVENRSRNRDRAARYLAIVVGLTAWTMNYFVGREVVELPPAYHDEYSYLFQAKTLFLFKFATPSHPSHPELFDQMHVLNEGKMASRYYPGTGLWLAPFVVIHHPYWGQWLASSLASVFVFWTGYELGRLRVAVVSGFACALSPGIALFGNLLLAHQPTLLGLTYFLWKFVKWQRSGVPRDAFYAGCGLSFAMLCRPATAAGFGVTFGVLFLYQCIFRKQFGEGDSWQLRRKSLVMMGVPLIVGWAVMLTYNQQVTGSSIKSPYQLYTDIYSPRHVYGFNNGTRGDQRQTPKVVKAYDRWAKNLTPELAAQNVLNRWLVSWQWTFDLLPLLLTFIVTLGSLFKAGQRWITICCAICCVHAIHVPYWFVGIMGWHYVFETAPLWCLLLGFVTDTLFREWRLTGRELMPIWWTALLLVSWVGTVVPVGHLLFRSKEMSRLADGMSEVNFPRGKYATFNKWLYSNVTDHPAIVLIESDLDDQHMDYVTTSPDLNDSVLRARYLRGVTSLEEIAKTFPHRFVYLCQPERRTIEEFHAPPEN